MDGCCRACNDHFNALYLYGRVSDRFYALSDRVFYGNVYRRFYADASIRRAGGCVGHDSAFHIKKLCLHGKAEKIFLSVSIAAAVRLYRVGHPQRAWAGHVDEACLRECFFFGREAGTVGNGMDSGGLCDLLYPSAAGQPNSGIVRTRNGTEKTGGPAPGTARISGGNEKKE